MSNWDEPRYRNWFDREAAWRRFDEDDDFQERAGALDRRWGYGERMRPGYPRRGRRPVDRASEYDYPDEYNAPDYWLYSERWSQPGPFEGVGPRGYPRSDEQILDDVCSRLTQHGEIDASDIEISVEDGEVTLKGTVKNRRMKRMVEANVEMIRGVIDVHNRLKLRYREDLEKQRQAEEMADRFPGGPTPTGPAGF